MEQLYEVIAASMKIEAIQVEAVMTLLREGSTVPFIARYRKERTKGLDEEQIRQIEEAYQYQEHLGKRKEDVLRLIDQQGMLTQELADAINACEKLTQVEDLYRPYQQKRKTRATMAAAKGLRPFAEWMLRLPRNGNIEQEARTYLNEKVNDIKEAIDGAKDIIAETVSDDAKVREVIRTSMQRYGRLVTKEKKKHEDVMHVYQMYYDYSERIDRIQPHRVMAVDRGEKEKVLQVDIAFNEEYVEQWTLRRYLKRDSIAKEIIEEAVLDGLHRLAYPSVEREVRNMLSEKAQEASIDVFSMNVERLLTQRPIKDKWVLGFDPAFRTGCKLAVIDATGKMVEISVIYPHPPKARKEEAKQELLRLLRAYPIEIIAIGNDESLATGIYARKDSPILGHTGYNALYPEMAGTGGTGRGKTILCTAGSSAHYTVHKWLEALSLTEKEVTIKDMPSEEALKAFLNGEGDAVALWSPYTLEAEQHGLMPVTLSSQCDASQPTLLLANKAFAKEHPALVTAFLKMYFRGITALQETPREQLIQDYRAFYHAWTGRDLPPQDAAWELAKHPVYGLKGQLTLFDPAQKKLHTWLQELASFAGGKNRLSDVTDVYLKKLAQ